MGLDLRMKGDTIPEEDNIARLCAPKTAPDGVIQATAFMLRMGEESLSVNWLEVLNCISRETEIAEIQNVYSSKLTIGMRAKLAVLNVGEVRDKVRTESSDSRDLEVLHAPETVDPSHSGIYNLKQNDVEISELILETVRESYPARTT